MNKSEANGIANIYKDFLILASFLHIIRFIMQFLCSTVDL